MRKEIFGLLAHLRSLFKATIQATGLQQLTLWEISSAGVLENTYSKNLPDVAIPSSITLKGVNLLIQGNSSKVASPTFSIALNTLGKFGAITYSKVISPQVPQVFTAKTAAYNWLSYVTSAPIKGVLGFTAHQKTTVLIKSPLKGGNTIGIYSVQGTPIIMRYQVGIGLIIATQYSGSDYLTVVHTK